MCRGKHLAMAAVAIAVGMLAASAQASVIYYDSFDRVGLLDDSAPNVRPGTETWTTAEGSDVATDGEVLTFGADRRNMFLPFTPGSAVYELSVDVMLDPASDSTDWHGLGFTGQYTDRPDDGNNMAFGNDPEGGRPWILLRNNGASLTFAGPGTSSNLGGPGTGTYESGVWHTLKLVLDTTGSQWTLDAYINGEAVIDTFTYEVNPGSMEDYDDLGAIGSVGLSTGGGSGFDYTFDNFMLIPEPASIGLLAVGGLGVLLRRKRS